jgi:hypothetical protein
MDAVKSMLKRGLGKIRDSFVAFSKQLDPDADCTELEEDAIALRIRWKDYLIALNNGADVTAWTRYKNWHEKLIKDRESGGTTTTGISSKPPLQTQAHEYITSSSSQVETHKYYTALGFAPLVSTTMLGIVFFFGFSRFHTPQDLCVSHTRTNVVFF